MNEILLAVTILLQIADGVSTYLALKRPDRRETNGLLAAIFNRIGILPGLILVKGFGVIVCVIAYLFAGVFAVWVLLAMAAGYACIVANNIRLL